MENAVQAELLASEKTLTFEAQQAIKGLTLTNNSTHNSSGAPIMFKIKTNKIDLIDAKPSCGYISGKSTHNKVTVSIRSLKPNQNFNAKLQILYVANSDFITEELVQKNQQKFDMEQYSEIYDKIKKSQNPDAKTLYVQVENKGLIQKSNSKTEELDNAQVKSTKTEKTEISQGQSVKSAKTLTKASRSHSEVKTRPKQSSEPKTVQAEKNSSGIKFSHLLIIVVCAVLFGFYCGFTFRGFLEKQNSNKDLSKLSVNQTLQDLERNVREPFQESDRSKIQKPETTAEKILDKTVNSSSGSNPKNRSQTADLGEKKQKYIQEKMPEIAVQTVKNVTKRKQNKK